jgi:protein-disulfide isomerase
MREVLLVSRWFYPADTSVLIWLARFALLVFAALAVGWVLRGRPKRIVTALVTAVSGVSAIACLAMAIVEVAVFEFSSPMAVAAYGVLLATFLWLIRQSRSESPRRVPFAVSFMTTTAAFAYLFFYGAIPSIVELDAKELGGVEGSNVLGRQSGALSITEFADFECPPCAIQDQIMDRLWVTYSDRIRYSFRHFPKPRHLQAEPAALASECAAEQGSFWETKRLLFSNQSRLGELLARPELPTIASAESRSYAECVQSRAGSTAVNTDRQWAQNLGLRVTPSIIVGNKLIQGVVRYPRLELIVRRELRERQIGVPQRSAVRVLSGCGSAAVQACSE